MLISSRVKKILAVWECQDQSENWKYQMGLNQNQMYAILLQNLSKIIKDWGIKIVLLGLHS